jgi:hypothetical protein
MRLVKLARVAIKLEMKELVLVADVADKFVITADVADNAVAEALPRVV